MVTEIVQHLQSEGYDVKDFVADGQIHRFAADSNDKKKSGFYVGYLNHTRSGVPFYLVVYSTWRSTEMPKKYHTFKGKMNAADKKYVEQQVNSAIKKAEEDRKKIHEENSQKISQQWDKLSSTGKSDYLDNKKLSGDFGQKYDNFSQEIIIPVRDIDGKIWSTQRISASYKKFAQNAKVSGCFHLIGKLNENKIYIAEGFATAATIQHAINSGVVCAFDSGNLKKVAIEFRKRFPDAEIFICGDDDKWKDPNKNPGREKASDAANECAGTAIFPAFEKTENKPTDFSDLYLNEGIEKVFEQITQIKSLVTREEKLKISVVNNPYPDESETGFKKKGTMLNVSEMLNRLGIIIRYNVISKEEEILIPGTNFTMDNSANATRAVIIDWLERVGIPTANLDSYITAIADTNQYNPVTTWIESKPWDNVSRLQDLYNTITAKDEKTDMNVLCMKEKLIRTWMISAIAGAYRPFGVSAHGVLVFQGDQNLGKTSWFKRLVPKELNVIADGMSLNPDNKDSVFQSIAKWLVELGELDATFKSDLSKLKAWLTKDRDITRRPFARKDSSYPRRTVFFGSVNPLNFLKDTTGNRRFWVIRCEKIAYDHDLDMQQIWAEIAELYKSGYSWVLTSGEIDSLNDHNIDFQEIDPVEERIRSHFEYTGVTKIERLTATEVCLQIGIREPRQNDTRSASRVLRSMLQTRPETSHRVTKYLFPVKYV